MQIIGIILIVFGGVGTIASLYLLFSVKSPFLSTEDGKAIKIQTPSIQTILSIIFSYFTLLHIMFVLIGVSFFLR